MAFADSLLFIFVEILRRWTYVLCHYWYYSIKSYSNTSYQNEALKSLTRYRFDKFQEPTSEIDEIEAEIKSIIDEINSPILTISGISYNMGAMIIAEIGDFNPFRLNRQRWNVSIYLLIRAIR